MIVPCMHDRRPDRSSALVLCGAGHKPNLDFSARIRAYREEGMDYRWRFTFQDFSPAFRANPLAEYFANIFKQRDDLCDVDRDRKSVVSGKSVSVRLDLGGGRMIKKNRRNELVSR